MEYKKYGTILLLALLISFSAQGQIVNIPDANFKNALINHDPIIDLNSDGEIQVSEALTAESILVNNQNIQDLTGIEEFLNLTQLSCINNQISNLDLSANTNLESIQCQINLVTSLDFTNNVNLGFLNCGSVNLVSLQLPEISTQIAVYCSPGQLTDIDVTQLPGLIVLAVNENNISTLDLSQNSTLTEVYVNNNNLTSINLDGASNLTRLQINNNPIQEVDISANLELNTVVFGNTGITNIDFSNHPDLIGVFGEDNLLESVNLKNGNNQIFTFLDLTNNPNLECIQVDDEIMATNGTGSYELWMKDPVAVYSEDCQSLGVNDHFNETISIYPNPTSNTLRIDSSLRIDSLFVLNSLGQVVFSQKGFDKTIELNLESLLSGNYFLKVFTSDSTNVYKIIKR